MGAGSIFCRASRSAAAGRLTPVFLRRASRRSLVRCQSRLACCIVVVLGCAVALWAWRLVGPRPCLGAEASNVACGRARTRRRCDRGDRSRADPCVADRWSRGGGHLLFGGRGQVDRRHGRRRGGPRHLRHRRGARLADPYPAGRRGQRGDRPPRLAGRSQGRQVRQRSCTPRGGARTGHRCQEVRGASHPRAEHRLARVRRGGCRGRHHGGGDARGWGSGPAVRAGCTAPARSTRPLPRGQP